MRPEFKNVPSNKVFWLQEGQSASNIKDLYMAIKDMNEENFVKFCNDEKNDFYNWIVDVLEDHELGANLAGVKSHRETQNIIKKYVAGVYLSNKNKSVSESLPLAPPSNPIEPFEPSSPFVQHPPKDISRMTPPPKPVLSNFEREKPVIRNFTSINPIKSEVSLTDKQFIKNVSDALPNPKLFEEKTQVFRQERRFKRAKAQEVKTILKQLSEVYDIGL